MPLVGNRCDPPRTLTESGTALQSPGPDSGVEFLVRPVTLNRVPFGSRDICFAPIQPGGSLANLNPDVFIGLANMDRSHDPANLEPEDFNHSFRRHVSFTSLPDL